MSTVASTSTSNQSTNPPGNKKASKLERINTALRAALYMHEDSTERWRKLRDEGAHDNQIWHALLKEFGGGGSSQVTGGDQFAYQGGDGAAQPKFWFSQGTYYTNEKPTLAGARLVKRVRELLEIPPFDDTKQQPQACPSCKAVAFFVDPLNPTSGSCGSCGATLVLNDDAGSPDDAAETTEIAVNSDGSKKEPLPVLPEGYRREKVVFTAPKNYKGLYGWVDFNAVGDAKARYFRDRDPGSWPQSLKWKVFDWSKLASSGDAAAPVGEDYRPGLDALDDAFLSDLEEQQRGRWATISEYDRLIEAATKKSEKKRLTNERAAIFKDYEDAYEEAVSALSGNADAVQEVRDRIESASADSATSDDASGASWEERKKQLDAACGADCGHTEEEHAAFDDGLRAGEQGLDDDACAVHHSLREAWLAGNSVGVLNRLQVGDRVRFFNQDVGPEGAHVDATIEALNFDTSPPEALLDYEGRIFTRGHETYGKSWQKIHDLERLPRSEAAHTPATEDAPATPATFKRFIEVELSDHDIALKAREAAQLRREQAQLESELSETSKTYKKKIGGLEEEIMRLLGAIDAGRDTLELEVFERRDFVRKVVETVRADSGAVVQERAMYPHETQRSLLSI